MAFATNQFILAFVTLTVAAINACMLYCWRDKIKIGIVLLKVSGIFMVEKPSIMIIGVTSLILNIVFLVVYAIGWLSAYALTLPEFNFS